MVVVQSKIKRWEKIKTSKVHTLPKKKRNSENQIKIDENSHLGRFEFLLFDDESFDPGPPELDAVFELIITGFPFACKSSQTPIRRKPS